MTSGLKYGMLCLTLSAAAFGQALAIASVPADPLELAVGPIQTAGTPVRASALQLLERARSNYQLRNAGQAWDLKVRFAVDSRGATNFDGAWTMEDRFVPGRGLHWTAQSSAGYSAAGIFAPKETYAEASISGVPLRLQEARAVLYNPLPSVSYAGSGSIRTFSANFRGLDVTCILLAHARNVQNPASGRGWEESEDCIDTQSGLLMLHSDAPGRYVVYDYSNAVRLGDRRMPGSVTVSEGGRVVSKIVVESLEGGASVEESLFVPTTRMMSAQMPAMASLQRITRIIPGGSTSAAIVRPVCVFGLVNSAGQLVEAHSLQPSDPNSDAAVKDARSINFAAMTAEGAPPEQHFVFVLEKFVTDK